MIILIDQIAKPNVLKLVKIVSNVIGMKLALFVKIIQCMVANATKLVIIVQKKECKINGICENSEDDCINDLYYGIDCRTPCTVINNTCYTCTRDGICTSCTSPEFWGDRCEKHCDNCPGNECYINGTCVDQNEIALVIFPQAKNAMRLALI